MSNTLSPYLAFNGQAREALELYRSVFGGTLRTVTFGESGVTGMGAPDALMHGQLDTEAGWTIMAADSTKPGDEVVRGGSTLCVWGDDAELMTQQFTALAAGGTVQMPLAAQQWGDTFGGLRDKFGVDWGFNIGSSGRQA